MKISKIILLVFLVTCMASKVLAEDVDIGLRLHEPDPGGTVSIAACSEECPNSPLNIYKNSKANGIKLVDTGNSSATKMRLKTTAGIKAVKKYVPFSGSFKKNTDIDSGTKVTWVVSITCASYCTCPGGASSKTFGTVNGNQNDIYQLMKNAGNDPGICDLAYCALQSKNPAGTVDTVTLNAICNILGYDYYTAYTSGNFQGLHIWYSPWDNGVAYWE